MTTEIWKTTDAAWAPEGKLRTKIDSIETLETVRIPAWAIACLLMTLWIAFAPIARTFFHGEISYNEGWNLYNSERLSEHQQLYPTQVGWTAVNYPMLSFYVAHCCILRLVTR